MRKKMKIASLIASNLLLFCILSTFSGCKKEQNEQVFKNPLYVVNDSINKNVCLITSNDAKLISDSSQLLQGIYKLQFWGTPIKYKEGDIIVNNENEGFLRKVTSSSINGNISTILTEQATFEDIFTNSNIKMNFDLTSSNNPLKSFHSESIQQNIKYLANGCSLNNDGFSYSFSNATIYQNGPLTFSITDGSISFNPNYIFDIDTRNGRINKLAFYFDNANLTFDCSINLNATQKISIVSFNKTLASIDKIYTIMIGELPVVAVVNLQLNAELTADIEASINLKSEIKNKYSLTLGGIYENGIWSDKYNLTSSLTGKPIEKTGSTTFIQKFSITPSVSVKLYGLIGPYFKPQIQEQFKTSVTSPSLDWYSKLDVGLNSTFGTNITIFGKTLADYSKTYSTTKVLWEAPYKIDMVSGNSQSGTAGQALPQPLKIKVTDNLNEPIKGAIVYFTVSSGGGSTNPVSSTTDENGLAETIWTLGNDNGIVNVQVKKNDGTDILGSPLSFYSSNSIKLDGKWLSSNGIGIIISGSIGTFYSFSSDWMPVVNNGIVKIGDPKITNIQKAGNNIWNCKDLRYNSSNTSQVAWVDGIISISNDGNSIALTSTNPFNGARIPLNFSRITTK